MGLASKTKTVLQSDIMELFKNACRTQATRKAYLESLAPFFKYTGMTANQLMRLPNRKLEDLIIAFIVHEKERKISFSNINNKRSALVKLCRIARKKLDWDSIDQYMPEKVKVVDLKPYTKEQLRMFYDILPLKYRCILLFLTSTGCRIGALPGLKIKHLTKLEGGIMRVLVYAGTREEYITYASPEFTHEFELYIKDRQTSFETITPESWAFRGDTYQRFYGKEAKAARPLRPNAVSVQFTLYSQRIGLRQRGSDKTKRKETSILHGMRHYFATQAIKSGKMQAINVDRLLGHRSSLLQVNYYRPDESTIIEEYKKFCRTSQSMMLTL